MVSPHAHSLPHDYPSRSLLYNQPKNLTADKFYTQTKVHSKYDTRKQSFKRQLAKITEMPESRDTDRDWLYEQASPSATVSTNEEEKSDEESTFMLSVSRKGKDGSVSYETKHVEYRSVFDAPLQTKKPPIKKHSSTAVNSPHSTPIYTNLIQGFGSFGAAQELPGSHKKPPRPKAISLVSGLGKKSDSLSNLTAWQLAGTLGGTMSHSPSRSAMEQEILPQKKGSTGSLKYHEILSKQKTQERSSSPSDTQIPTYKMQGFTRTTTDFLGGVTFPDIKSPQGVDAPEKFGNINKFRRSLEKMGELTYLPKIEEGRKIGISKPNGYTKKKMKFHAPLTCRRNSFNYRSQSPQPKAF